MQPIIYLFLLLIATVILLLAYLIGEKRKHGDIEERLLATMFNHDRIYFRDELLTQNEQRFYRDLQKKFGTKYHILPKLSLNALLNVKVQDQELQSKHPHIGKFYFDFVLCTQADFKPVIAIELNDKVKSHHQRKLRDAYFLSALQSANIKYFSCESNYLTYDHYMEDVDKTLHPASPAKS